MTNVIRETFKKLMSRRYNTKHRHVSSTTECLILSDRIQDLEEKNHKVEKTMKTTQTEAKEDAAKEEKVCVCVCVFINFLQQQQDVFRLSSAPGGV